MSWEQRLTRDKFVDDASKGPHVNRVVILHAEDNLWRPIVPALNIEESRGAVLTTGAEVDQLNVRIALVFKYDILWLQITMNYVVVFQILQPLDHLEADGPELLGLKNLLQVLVAFYESEQVEVEHLEYYYDVLAELECVEILDYAVFTLARGLH